MARQYWLMKSEPEVFGIGHLAQSEDQTTPWEGVRNYQVRNMLRDQMKQGDLAFFYHSNCKPPGIVGIMEVVREGYPDHTAFDPESRYHDPKNDPGHPRWYRVDVRLVRQLKRTITLEELKPHPGLADMPLLRRGNRLSITPVSAAEWRYILDLE